MSNAQKEIRISEVLGLLQGANGQKPMSRKEIAVHYGVSYASMARDVFSHPKLKNRKVLPAADFTVIDDAPDAPEAKERVTSQESVQVAPVTEDLTEDTPQAKAFAEEDTSDPDFR